MKDLKKGDFSAVPINEKELQSTDLSYIAHQLTHTIINAVSYIHIYAFLPNS